MQMYDYIDEHGYSPITYAISCGHFYIVTNLLKDGADVNFKDGFDSTPLITILVNYDKFSYYINDIITLLEYGADINILCEYEDIKYTAIDYALQIYSKDNYQIIKLLLLNGATINTLSFCKSMSLFLKYNYCNKIKIINLLLDHGLDYQIVYTIYKLDRNNYNFLTEQKKILDFLSDDEYDKINKTIQSIELSKHCKNIVNSNILAESNKIIFKPDGFMFKLLSIKYDLINDQALNSIKFRHLELFEYFGIYDIPSLIVKITECIKYI
ncbi:ankyrin repeat protein [Megavirus baoshan]|uniref:Ankyrin repeat protein n=1 Tax=Megavirus baoshan TaxID=2496520 RepID=A0A3S5HLF0_9VIRU|nr:ankyrin repeat protein [Megavirus baoshan]AZL89791.1 ankyrin repeat protein [Megavirus baoshan]